MERKTVHINLPTAIYESIQRLAVDSGMYRGVPEFVVECARNRIYELKQQKIEREQLNIYYKKQKEKMMQSYKAEEKSL
jgi:hypothetical protein